MAMWMVREDSICREKRSGMECSLYKKHPGQHRAIIQTEHSWPQRPAKRRKR